MRKILIIICLILWSMIFCIDVVYIMQGVTVSPLTAAMPALVCIMLYAEKLYKG